MPESRAPNVSVMTGNEAAATAAKLARVQVIAAYPITPQSPVVEQLSRQVESGELQAEFVTVESEHSALTVCIAAATVGARVFTATSSNGLAYMNEQVWWAAGARLPIVMGIVNRALAAPWNVLNDQQDSMSERDAGWIQLYCRDNQEILDTFLQAFRIAETVNVPVMVCYDGFLLSHTVMPVDVPEQAAVDAFLPSRPEPLTIIDPSDPRNIGQVTLADPRADAEGVACHGYMELRALHQQAIMDALDVIPRTDAAYGEAIGRSWGGLFWEDRLDDAEIALVAAGSLATQLTVAVDALRAEGVKAGVLGIRAYRPFPAAALARRPRRSPGGARLRQSSLLRLRRPDLQRSAGRAVRRSRRARRLRRDLRPRRSRHDARGSRRGRTSRPGRPRRRRARPRRRLAQPETLGGAS